MRKPPAEVSAAQTASAQSFDEMHSTVSDQMAKQQEQLTAAQARMIRAAEANSSVDAISGGEFGAELAKAEKAIEQSMSNAADQIISAGAATGALVSDASAVDTVDHKDQMDMIADALSSAGGRDRKP